MISDLELTKFYITLGLVKDDQNWKDLETSVENLSPQECRQKVGKKQWLWTRCQRCDDLESGREKEERKYLWRWLESPPTKTKSKISEGSGESVQNTLSPRCLP